jgi:hypothetical protein
MENTEIIDEFRLKEQSQTKFGDGNPTSTKSGGSPKARDGTGGLGRRLAQIDGARPRGCGLIIRDLAEQDGGAGPKEGTGYIGTGAKLRVRFEQRVDEVEKIVVHCDRQWTAGLITERFGHRLILGWVWWRGRADQDEDSAAAQHDPEAVTQLCAKGPGGGR